MSESPERLRDEFVDWIDKLADWTTFATLTFAGEYTEQAAQRAWNRWSKKHLPDASWFYVMERNPNRAGHHLHAVLGNVMGLQRRDLWRSWFVRFGRAKIEPIRSRQDVVDYCSKHVSHYLLKSAGYWDLKIVQPELPDASA